VQPKLSAISGVQRADLFGERTFAMRIWLKPDRMAAHGISPSQVHDVWRRTNYLSALGRTKGSMVSVNLVANTDLKTAEEFRRSWSRKKTVVVPPGQSPPSSWAPRDYEQDPLQRPDRHLHRHLGAATPTRWK